MSIPPSKRQAREKLKADTERFLAAGGEITHVPMGQLGDGQTTGWSFFSVDKEKHRYKGRLTQKQVLKARQLVRQGLTIEDARMEVCPDVSYHIIYRVCRGIASSMSKKPFQKRRRKRIEERLVSEVIMHMRKGKTFLDSHRLVCPNVNETELRREVFSRRSDFDDIELG